MSQSEEKRIVIIGASSGIGRRVALDLAGRGWRVGIAARRVDRLKEIAAKCSDRISYRAIDVGADDAVENMMALIDEIGGMDTLLYAAGVGYQDPDIDSEILDQTLRTNVDGFSRIITAAYKYLRTKKSKHKGQIAAITSIAGTKGIGLAAAYSATKRYEQIYLDAIDQLAHSRKEDITITDIRPGFIRTALLSDKRRYPMEMSLDYAVPRIERAIIKGKRVAIVDWRWAIVVELWRLVPQWIWNRLRLDI
ncbi:MAG: SDR family NAD(P)-dependent oxidoreductase [Bacteroides sp.]|nr:SDR family NAD(P)-dependent oxidoreductase [Bacteroides sp.]MCM1412939.1 SDR family NAD(P)-dependent oxidoreductase [Bacteroides sp.]MCM1471618.1 SDR family NAD(P)-dependent oxidoreductase [Bacteroides sp.]